MFWVNGFAGGQQRGLPDRSAVGGGQQRRQCSRYRFSRTSRAWSSGEHCGSCLCPLASALPWAALRLARSASRSPGEGLGTRASARTWAFALRKTGVPRPYLSPRGFHGHQVENRCQGPGREPAEPGGGRHGDAGLTTSLEPGSGGGRSGQVPRSAGRATPSP